MKKALSIIMALIMCIGAITVFPVCASAEEADIADTGADADVADTGEEADIVEDGADVDLAEDGEQYGAWSQWSSTPAYASSTRQVETRRVIVSYDMEGNCCGNANGQRCYLKYMQSGYTLRLHYDRGTYSKAEVDSWAQWPQGSYYTYAPNVNGYIIGPGTAYIEPRNSVPLFIVGTNYGTEYRYRDRVYTPIYNCSVSLSQSSYTYDGKAKTPSVTVKYGSTLLYQGRDYTVSYRNNVNVGTASVIIYGIGDYNQSTTKYFTIIAKPAEDPKKLTAPKLKSVDNINGGVLITWYAVNGAVKYRVFCKVNGGSWNALGDTKGLKYIHKKAKSGAKYTYTVRCVSADGKKILSPFDTKGKTTKFIATPIVNKCRNVTKGIQLIWGACKGAAKYCVFIKNGSSWKKLKYTTATSYIYTGAKSGKSYTFTVRCVTSNGKTFTSACNSKGWTVTFYAAPKMKRLVHSYDSIGVWWQQVSGAKAYCVYYRKKNTAGSSSWSSWYKLAIVRKNEYGTDNDYYHRAAGGYKYQYRVQCVTENGSPLSAYSKNSEAMRFCRTPHIYQGCKGSGFLRFYWYDVDGAYKYKIYIWDDANNKWKTLGTTFSTVYYYYTSNTYGTYKFAVRVIDENGFNMSELSTVRMENYYSTGFHIYTNY